MRSSPLLPRRLNLSQSSMKMDKQALATPTLLVPVEALSFTCSKITCCPNLLEETPKTSRASGKIFTFTPATAVGAITSLALSAIDTALWDLRCKRAGLPLWKLVGGAKPEIPVYSTEGGWLHIPTADLVQDALDRKAEGFGGCKIKVGSAHVAEDVERLQSVRQAVGPTFEIMTDANQAFTQDEAIRRARHFEPIDIAWFEEPLPAEDLGGHIELNRSTSIPIAVGESMYHPLIFVSTCNEGPATLSRWMSPALGITRGSKQLIL